MPRPITEYSIFIATPSGLEEERRVFYTTLTDYSTENRGRNIVFTPVGWEITLGGVGRPQELINRDLVKCDYFILVLWDRWGSPTSAEPEEGYSSGCEEEFELASACRADSKFHMKQLVVFFKNVDSHAYKDPGPQLQKVLSFRKELEQTKKHLFMQFSSLEVFQGQLRKFLAEWLIEQETRQREMPEQEHVEILKGGLPVWNTWRANHRESVPNLVRADLRGQYLSGFNLEGADLSRADLTGADLTGAKLSQAILREALLANANLFRAEMLGADLHNAVFVNSHLSEANLRGARLKLTTVASTDLSSTVGLESVLHDGPSTIGLDTVYKSQGRIPLSFLRGAGTPENFIEYMRSLTGSAFEYYSCFIAYSTWDQAFADRLYADLQSRGIRCWFAPHDIVAGSKLSPQIDEAIRFYEKVLLILSDHSIRSSWLRFEIKTAIERETQTGEPVLFPIRLVPYEPLAQWKWIDADTGTDLARELRQYFIADFSDWKDHDSYVKSFDRLLRDLRR